MEFLSLPGSLSSSAVSFLMAPGGKDIWWHHNTSAFFSEKVSTLPGKFVCKISMLKNVRVHSCTPGWTQESIRFSPDLAAKGSGKTEPKPWSGEAKVMKGKWASKLKGLLGTHVKQESGNGMFCSILWPPSVFTTEFKTVLHHLSDQKPLREFHLIL